MPRTSTDFIAGSLSVTMSLGSPKVEMSLVNPERISGIDLDLIAIKIPYFESLSTADKKILGWHMKTYCL